MKKSLLLAVSASALLGACTYDHPMDHNQQGMWHHDHMEHARMEAEYCFHKMDMNHDGVITRREAMLSARKMFDAADANHDGKVTLDEFVAQKMHEKEEMHGQWHHHDGMRDGGQAMDGQNYQPAYQPNYQPAPMNSGTQY